MQVHVYYAISLWLKYNEWDTISSYCILEHCQYLHTGTLPVPAKSMHRLWAQAIIQFYSYNYIIIDRIV